MPEYINPMLRFVAKEVGRRAEKPKIDFDAAYQKYLDIGAAEGRQTKEPQEWMDILSVNPEMRQDAYNIYKEDLSWEEWNHFINYYRKPMPMMQEFAKIPEAAMGEVIEGYGAWFEFDDNAKAIFQHVVNADVREKGYMPPQMFEGEETEINVEEFQKFGSQMSEESRSYFEYDSVEDHIFNGLRTNITSVGSSAPTWPLGVGAFLSTAATTRNMPAAARVGQFAANLGRYGMFFYSAKKDLIDSTERTARHIYAREGLSEEQIDQKILEGREKLMEYGNMAGAVELGSEAAGDLFFVRALGFLDKPYAKGLMNAWAQGIENATKAAPIEGAEEVIAFLGQQAIMKRYLEKELGLELEEGDLPDPVEGALYAGTTGAVAGAIGGGAATPLQRQFGQKYEEKDPDRKASNIIAKRLMERVRRADMVPAYYNVGEVVELRDGSSLIEVVRQLDDNVYQGRVKGDKDGDLIHFDRSDVRLYEGTAVPTLRNIRDMIIRHAQTNPYYEGKVTDPESGKTVSIEDPEARGATRRKPATRKQAKLQADIAEYLLRAMAVSEDKSIDEYIEDHLQAFVVEGKMTDFILSKEAGRSEEILLQDLNGGEVQADFTKFSELFEYYRLQELQLLNKEEIDLVYDTLPEYIFWLIEKADEEADSTPIIGNLDVDRHYQFDAVHGLAQIEEGTVQAIITSPPYFGKKHIDYDIGEGDLGRVDTEEQYLEYMKHVLIRSQRVLKEDGVMVINISDTRQGEFFLTPEKLAVLAQDVGLHVFSKTRWRKTNTRRKREGAPTQLTEDIFVLSKSKKPKYHTKKIQGKEGEPYVRGDVVEGAPANIPWHPAPMPRSLAQLFIDEATDPGDVVVDPFSGSGTVGKISAENGRHFVGFDLNKEYVERSNARLLAEERKGKGFALFQAPHHSELNKTVAEFFYKTKAAKAMASLGNPKSPIKVFRKKDRMPIKDYIKALEIYGIDRGTIHSAGLYSIAEEYPDMILGPDFDDMPGDLLLVETDGINLSRYGTTRMDIEEVSSTGYNTFEGDVVAINSNSNEPVVIGHISVEKNDLKYQESYAKDRMMVSGLAQVHIYDKRGSEYDQVIPVNISNSVKLQELYDVTPLKFNQRPADYVKDFVEEGDHMHLALPKKHLLAEVLRAYFPEHFSLREMIRKVNFLDSVTLGPYEVALPFRKSESVSMDIYRKRDDYVNLMLTFEAIYAETADPNESSTRKSALMNTFYYPEKEELLIHPLPNKHVDPITISMSSSQYSVLFNHELGEDGKMTSVNEDLVDFIKGIVLQEKLIDGYDGSSLTTTETDVQHSGASDMDNTDYVERLYFTSTGPGRSSSHYRKETPYGRVNMAHARFDVRMGENGKVMFVIEIQSDHHQKGNKYGYNFLSQRNQKVAKSLVGNTAIRDYVGQVLYLGDVSILRDPDLLMSDFYTWIGDTDGYGYDLVQAYKKGGMNGRKLNPNTLQRAITETYYNHARLQLQSIAKETVKDREEHSTVVHTLESFIERFNITDMQKLDEKMQDLKAEIEEELVSGNITAKEAKRRYYDLIDFISDNEDLIAIWVDAYNYKQGDYAPSPGMNGMWLDHVLKDLVIEAHKRGFTEIAFPSEEHALMIQAGSFGFGEFNSMRTRFIRNGGKGTLNFYGESLPGKLKKIAKGRNSNESGPRSKLTTGKVESGRYSSKTFFDDLYLQITPDLVDWAQDPVFQRGNDKKVVKGATWLRNQTQAAISIFRSGDLGTIAHEFAHLWVHSMTGEQRRYFQTEYVDKYGEVGGQEAFANDFLNFIMFNKAIEMNQERLAVLNMAREHLLNLYNRTSDFGFHKEPLSPEASSFFENAFIGALEGTGDDALPGQYIRAAMDDHAPLGSLLNNKEGIRRLENYFEHGALFRGVGKGRLERAIPLWATRQDAVLQQIKMVMRGIDALGLTREERRALALYSDLPQSRYEAEVPAAMRNKIEPGRQLIRAFFQEVRQAAKASGILEYDHFDTMLNWANRELGRPQNSSPDSQAALEEFVRTVELAKKRTPDEEAAGFVHIMMSWFASDVKHNPKRTLSTLQSLSYKMRQKRRTFFISDLLEKDEETGEYPGGFDPEKVDIIDSVWEYGFMAANDIAWNTVIRAGIEDGLVRKLAPNEKLQAQTGPIEDKGWQIFWSYPPRGFKMLEGYKVDKVLLNYIQSMNNFHVEYNPFARLVTKIKLWSFTKPLLLATYNLFQHAAVARSRALLFPHYVGKAFKHLYGADGLGEDSFNMLEYMARAAKDHMVMSTFAQAVLWNGVAGQPYPSPYRDLEIDKMKKGPWYNRMIYDLTMWENEKKEGDSVAKHLGKNVGRAAQTVATASPFYRLIAWKLAWQMDRIQRVATAMMLVDKGFTIEEAAWTANRFHGAYTSVHPKLRTKGMWWLYTPTFKIAMSKLVLDNIKETVRQTPALNKPRTWKDRNIYHAGATGALGLMIASNIAVDFLMNSLGYEDDDWGVRYVKRLVDDEGAEFELVTAVSTPFNLVLRHLYRQVREFAGVSQRPIADALASEKYQLTPMFPIIIALLNNQKPSGGPIYDEYDLRRINLPNGLGVNYGQFADMAKYIYVEALPWVKLTRGIPGFGDDIAEAMGDSFWNDTDELVHRILYREHAYWHQFLLNQFSFSYVRKPEWLRVGRDMEELKRGFGWVHKQAMNEDISETELMQKEYLFEKRFLELEQKMDRAYFKTHRKIKGWRGVTSENVVALPEPK